MTQRYSGSPQRIGDLAEYLVACDLIGQGYRIHMASPGSHYDIILDYNGRLYRVQVKGSLKPKKAKSYRFHVRGTSKHKNFDLLAYVAIDEKSIAYELTTSVNQRILSLKHFKDMTIAKALTRLSLKEIANTEAIEALDDTL